MQDLIHIYSDPIHFRCIVLRNSLFNMSSKLLLLCIPGSKCIYLKEIENLLLQRYLVLLFCFPVTYFMCFKNTLVNF